MLLYNVVFLHQREDKLWIGIGVLPKKSQTIHLGIHSETEIISVTISINEKNIILRNKPSGQCRNYGPSPAMSFNDCNMKYIQAYLQKTANCTIPGNTYEMLTLFA